MNIWGMDEMSLDSGLGSPKQQSREDMRSCRIAVIGSKAFADNLSLVADVISVNSANLDSLPDTINAILVIPSESLRWGLELSAGAEKLKAMRREATARCARLDLYDFNAVMSRADLAAATSLFDAVITNRPAEFGKPAAPTEIDERLYYFPYPISGQRFSPVDLDKARRRELVYCKNFDRPIPVSARRVLSGASVAKLATKIYSVTPGPANETSIETGVDLGNNVIHRVEVLPNNQDYEAISRFAEFAVCDWITPADDPGGVGILGHLARGTIVFADYSRFVNGVLPSVAMLESGDDLQSFIGNLPEEYFALARIDGIRQIFTKFTFWEWIACYEEVFFDRKASEPVVAVIARNYADFEDFTSTQTVSGRFIYACDDNEADAAIGTGRGLKIYLDRIPFRSPNLYADLKSALRYSSATHFEVCAADDPRTAYVEAEGEEAFEVHAVRVSTECAPASSILIRTDVLINASNLNKPNFGVLADRDLTIVIPVFNNGRYLLYKGLQSLWRESIQDVAEVQLVDDGSTDAETLHILELLELSNRLPTVLRLAAGGSGSAARPRNVALDHVQSRYVTFLDPDDEQMGRGYHQLLEGITESHSDIAIGNTVVRRGGRVWVGNVPNVEKGLKQLGLQQDSRGRYDLGTDNRELLKSIYFQPFSIQATIANTDFLNKYALRQAEGAYGEDSLFSLKMLYAAESVSFVRSSIFVYNAEVPGSAVNSISLRFFEKSLLAEKEQVEWLDSLGLKGDYASRRFMKMLKVWYLQKVNELGADHKESGLEIIHSMAQLYGSAVTENDEYREVMRAAGLPL